MNASELLNNASSHVISLTTAAMDRSFLDSVRGEFYRFGMSSETVQLIVWTLLVAGAAGGTMFLLNRYIFNKRARKKVPSGAVAETAKMQALLDAAITQRSKMEVGFSLPEHGVKPMNCYIENVKGNLLNIELPAYIQPTQKWIGRTVNCYFKVKETKAGNPNYYNFSTEIAGISKLENGGTRITLPLPESMVLQQKRVHLRISPPMRLFLGVAIWPEQLTSSARPINQIKQWSRPALIFHRGKKDHMLVANISAGGMRVDIPNKSVKRTGLDFEIGNIFHLLIDLYSPDKSAKQRLWATARVQNRFEDIENSKLEIGFKFTHQGEMVGEGNAASVMWRKVGDDGIMPLGNWVFKRHLETVRKLQAG